MLLHLAENREHELATDVEQPWLGTALTDFEPEAPLNSSSNSTNGPLSSPRNPPNEVVCSNYFYFNYCSVYLTTRRVKVLDVLYGRTENRG